MTDGLRDPDMRAVLRRELAGQRIVEEWPVFGSRVDVATIRPTLLSAYEIKSPADSLVRLAYQVQDYGRVFDVCTLVTTSKHHRSAAKVVPEWWGISLVDGEQLAIARPPTVNPDVDAAALAQLLWVRELRAVLQHNEVISAIAPRINKAKLVQLAAKHIGVRVFRLMVCEVLLNRGPAWRPEAEN